MIAMGCLHWALPSAFAAAVPDYLPGRLALALVSGLFEVAGGVGLLIARTRKIAAWGLVALYVAVYPANVNMAMRPEHWVSDPYRWVLYLRLPLQVLPIAWAYWMTRE